MAGGFIALVSMCSGDVSVLQVLQNILETERDYAKELQSLLGTYLRPLQSYDKLSAGDIMALLGNMEEISAFQQTLNQALEEVAKRHLNLYDVLLKIVPSQNTTTVSFLMQLTKLCCDSQSQCQELRKRKQLELQILSESIQCWEGEDIKMMGNIIYMSQVMVQSGGSEEKEERYFLLFSNVLLMLSASPRMSGFIYQGKLPLTGMTLTKLEDAEGNEHMFEIT
ncbi:hypothetical protein HGM15179_021267, partial [Zosterops borbonicus]